MSDELPTTADGAIRAYLFAIGFTLVLIGGEMMAEKDGSRFTIGLVLGIAALPVHLAWVFWERLKPRIGSRPLIELNSIATSPRWWFGGLFVLLSALVYSPVVQAPRWPTFPLSRTEMTTLPTTLRLQFNSVGSKPEGIEEHNIKWAITSYDEQRKETPDRKYVCDPNTVNQGITTTTPLFGQPQMNCSYVDFPNYHEVLNTILFLAFDQPISSKTIKLNAHGATIPKWDISTLNNRLATIYFHGEMAHMILDVEVVN
jgi:hypothetical protein